ncbi:13533_t:CDS:2 [Gigaspora rosea]|nr:13533_t:CDS:2 [Gigaspora rosea]
MDEEIWKSEEKRIIKEICSDHSLEKQFGVSLLELEEILCGKNQVAVRERRSLMARGVIKKEIRWYLGSKGLGKKRIDVLLAEWIFFLGLQLDSFRIGFLPTPIKRRQIVFPNCGPNISP